MYMFSNDSRIQEKFLKFTTSGGTTVNDIMMHGSCMYRAQLTEFTDHAHVGASGRVNLGEYCFTGRVD